MGCAMLISQARCLDEIFDVRHAVATVAEALLRLGARVFR